MLSSIIIKNNLSRISYQSPCNIPGWAIVFTSTLCIIHSTLITQCPFTHRGLWQSTAHSSPARNKTPRIVLRAKRRDTPAATAHYCWPTSNAKYAARAHNSFMKFVHLPTHEGGEWRVALAKTWSRPVALIQTEPDIGNTVTNGPGTKP